MVLNARAMAPKASKSERVSQGGSVAALNACTYGCMSVLEMSAFSYQVAAGSTTSDTSVVEVIRKSIDIIRSSLPSGMSPSQVTSTGRTPSSGGTADALESVPSRCRRKYSPPLPDEPIRLARHTVSTRGQLTGLSGSVTASLRLRRPSCSATYSATSRPAARASSATSRLDRSNCG